MEAWLIYAILSIFALGLYGFSHKVAAEKNYDVGLISIYVYVITFLISAIILFINKNFLIIDLFFVLFLLGFINGLFYLLSVFSRVQGMKYIDTVIFYPIYKTFGPIIVTSISLFYFQEALTLKEIIGIIVGISVPLLLITKSENKIQKNLFKGIILVLITALLTSIVASVNKVVIVKEYDMMTFILLVSFFGSIFSGILYKSQKNNKKIYNGDGVVKFSIISGILHFLAFYTFIAALEGNLAVVFTINSFSILIPIILSIIFYKEHFSFKKGFVIFLSIVSILLFI